MRTRAQRGAAQLALGAAAFSLASAAAGCGLVGKSDTITVSAEFERTVGLYENSDVRILGVKVGKVIKIVPNGRTMRVTFEVDEKHKVPAGAQAVVVAPSIVSDRYVQLTPVYTGGPQMRSGTAIAPDATAVPVELDDIFAAVDKLDLALGPNGANSNGALQDLLDVSAQNLDGNGGVLNSTLTSFSTAVKTLADQKDDLFGTVRNLSDFTTTIAKSDDTIREFNSSLAVVAEQLEGEKEDLALAIRQLSIALGEVATFVRDNKVNLTANVSDLADITGVLVKQKAALEEFLDTAPAALSNLQLAYNPASGTLDTRANNFAGQLGPSLCNLATSLPQVVRNLCGGLLDGLSVAEIEALLANPQNLAPELIDRLNGLLGNARAGTVTTKVPTTGLTVTDLLGGGR